MKANEAPDKIYRTTTYLDNDKGKTLWKKDTVEGAENIEYTRTDAFVEKACDWLEEHIYEYLKMNRTWNEPDYDPKLIGDFKKYMKGE